MDAATPRGRPKKGGDPERVRENILAVARREFVRKGLSGARVNEIAGRTKTSKRMIYYYFGDKEALYLAVLEEAYGRIRDLEKKLRLETLTPLDALAALAGFTFDYHADNPDFVRLVMIENIHHGRHLKHLTKIGEMNLSALDVIRAVYERGVAEGVFRSGLDPIDIHLLISAQSFYAVSNRASISQVFGYDMGAAESRAFRRNNVIEATCRFVAQLNLQLAKSK